MAASKTSVLNVRLSDDVLAQVIDAVIDYEAAARRLTRGQAVYEILVESAELDAYPTEIRARLKDIEQQRLDRAVRESLAASQRGKVA